MAYALKYRYEWDLITASSASWDAIRFEIHQEGFDAADGPISLEGQENPAEINFPEPRAGESIAPCEILFNLFNRRYAPDEDNVFFSSTGKKYYAVMGDGSGDIWTVGDNEIHKFTGGDGTPTVQDAVGSIMHDIRARPNVTGTLIAVGDANAIRNTTNGGTTWIQRSYGAPGTSFLQSVSYSLGASNILALGGKDSSTGEATLGRSSDFGNTWSNQNAHVAFAHIPGGSILSLALVTDNLLFMAVNGGDVYKMTNFTSGPTPATKVTALSNIRKIQFINSNNGIAMGRSNADFWTTTDGGTNWVQRTGTPSQDVLWGLHYVSDKLVIIIGDDNHIEYSSDLGNNWDSIQTNLPGLVGDVGVHTNNIYFKFDN